MKKGSVFIILIYLFAFFLVSDVKNEDRPLRGEWDFKMEKILETENAGNDVFANISKIFSDGKENLYVMDIKNFKIYIFNKDGKFITSFGKKGEGPGEIKWLINFFLVNNYLIIRDNGKLHFFSKKGRFIKSIIISREIRPRQFVDENTLISVPWMNWRDPKSKSKAFLYYIKDKSKKLLFEFSTFKEGVIRKKTKKGNFVFSFADSTLTPMMVLNYNNSKVYYGMNSSYKINITDLNMRKLLSFSLERKKRVVPKQYKDKAIKNMRFPENIKEEVKKRFPDHFTYFERIYIDENGMIYVFATDAEKENRKKIDIFSSKGKYIYSSEIKIDKDSSIKLSHIKKNKLYLAVEDEDGEIKIIKYKIVLPVE